MKQRRKEFALPVGWNRSHSDVTNRTSSAINASKPSTRIQSPISKSNRSVIFQPTFPKPSKLSLAVCQNRRTQKSGNGRRVDHQAPSHTFNISYRGVQLFWAADLTPHCGKSQGLVLEADWLKNNQFYTSMLTASSDACFIPDSWYINRCRGEFDSF